MSTVASITTTPAGILRRLGVATAADSPVLIFEGTYTAEFADRPPPTPRYNYNQMLYRLDLDDPALAPAQK